METQQKRALVCGSSSGIGREIAIELSKRGIQCILLARRKERLLDVQQEILDIEGPEPILLVGDLEQIDSVLTHVDQLLQTGPIHILINNTGGPKGGPLLQAAPDAFISAFQRHIIAAHLLSQKLVPAMQSAGFGRIVNIISTSVYEPIPNLGVSNTIRGAMASWAKSLSRGITS